MYNFAVSPKRMHKTILRSNQYVEMLGDGTVDIPKKTVGQLNMDEQPKRSFGYRKSMDLRNPEVGKIEPG